MFVLQVIPLSFASVKLPTKKNDNNKFYFDVYQVRSKRRRRGGGGGEEEERIKVWFYRELNDVNCMPRVNDCETNGIK